MSELHQRIVDLVNKRGYERRDEPFRLASGQWSQDYIDGKRVVADGDDLRLVAEAALVAVGDGFDTVGGLTMGADPLAHAIALVKGCKWFSVRKKPKGRGLNKWIEGAELGVHSRVLLVDDVVTSGGSILLAYEQVCQQGASIVGALTLVDRGDTAGATFAALGVPYHVLVTHSDLGIDPVGPGVPTASRY